MILKSRWRSFSCAFSVVKMSGCADGSSTICANITARAAASGRRAHHRCNVRRMPMPDRLLPRRGLVDRFERQSDFDEFLSCKRSSADRNLLPVQIQPLISFSSALCQHVNGLTLNCGQIVVDLFSFINSSCLDNRICVIFPDGHCIKLPLNILSVVPLTDSYFDFVYGPAQSVEVDQNSCRLYLLLFMAQ